MERKRGQPCISHQGGKVRKVPLEVPKFHMAADPHACAAPPAPAAWAGWAGQAGWAAE